MRYFVRFSYVGTDFHGSQRQPNGITVQEVMEEAFATIFRQPVPLTFAGRTDAGVHAVQMYAHFDIEKPDDNPVIIDALARRLNSLLPPSVAVEAVMPVTEDAHARFSAVSRTYHYLLTDSKNPFLFGKTAHVPVGLDYDRMNEAASLLLGKHDFASFCRVHTDVKTTVCDVSEACWKPSEIGSFPIMRFTITANRFLRNMVRAVVGTLLDVGRGKMTTEQFADVLQARNRCSAGQSAPADGLYLVRVDYPQTIL